MQYASLLSRASRVGLILAAITLAGCGDPLGVVTGQTLVASEQVERSGAGLGDAVQASTQAGYALYELGAGSAGELWQIEIDFNARSISSVSIVLMDAEQNILTQRTLSRGRLLEHRLRRDTANLLLGVRGTATVLESFSFAAARSVGQPPAAAAQRVLLDFRAASNVRIASKPAVSFAAFDGAMVGEAYADATQEIKDAIIATVRAHYAPYRVDIYSSDEPLPDPPYSTLHFGGSDAALLGSANSIDRYNQDPEDNAIVYVGSFARYWTMDLTPQEMGQMIGNTAGHELGHLLGLYHASGPAGLMDTRGTAWDFAGPRRLGIDPLESDVFPTGYEHGPLVVMETVGLRDGFSEEQVVKAAPRGRLMAALWHYGAPAAPLANWCDCAGAPAAD